MRYVYLILFSFFIFENTTAQETELSLDELDSMVLLSFSKGNYDLALSYAEKSYKTTFKLHGKNKDYSYSLNNLAVISLTLGLYEEAEPLFLEAIEVDRALYGDKSGDFAISLNNMADLYVQLDKYTEAERLMWQALEINKSNLGEEAPDYGINLNNLAALYKRMNRYDEAIELVKKAVAIEKKQAKKITDYALALNNLAVLYKTVEKYAAAEELYLEVIQIYKKAYGTQHPSYATVLSNLGALYEKMNRFDAAEELLLESFAIRKATLNEKHPDYLDFFEGIAELYLQSNELEQAKAFLEQALSKNTACQTPIKLEDLKPLTDCPFIYNRIGINALKKVAAYHQVKFNQTNDVVHLERKHESIEIALALNNKIRKEFNLEKDKLRLLTNMSEWVGMALSNSSQLLERTKDRKSLLSKAFANAEQNKSILLVDALKGQRARVLGDLPDSLVIQEQDLQKRVSRLKKAFAVAETPEEQSLITQKQNDLSHEVNNFQQLLKDKFPKYHALKYENIIASVEDVQGLLEEGTALLEYFVEDSLTYLFYISQTEVDFMTIPISKMTLEEEVKAFRKSLSNYKFILSNEGKALELYTEKAFWFYKQYVHPMISKKEGIKHLQFVMDGELGNLPFEALLTQESRQSKGGYSALPYLIKDYGVSYDYSATLWKENLSQRSAQENRIKKNTTFKNGQILACASTYGHVDTTKLQDLRSPHLVKLRHSLQPLSAAISEVKLLESLYEGQFLFDSMTNETNFKEQAANYSVIHLAMHGILNPRLPILSSLAFSENLDTLEDNFLQAYEISHLHLNADLVVLSACETGYGKFEQGEGVLSLARSFMYAGVPSLVVSLWQVNDASTALIMQPFYENLEKGLPKDEALRLAKLNYLQNASGVAAHPAFWSPFIQLGDSRPIVLQAKGGTSKVYLLGIAVLLLLITIFVFKFKRKRAA